MIISALDSTFQRKGFGVVLELIPLCESVTKLTAVCADCGKDASFTKRLAAEEELGPVRSAETYKPVCRECFMPRSGVRLSLSKCCAAVKKFKMERGDEIKPVENIACISLV